MAFDAPVDEKTTDEAATSANIMLARIVDEAKEARRRKDEEAFMRRLLYRPGC